MAAINNLQSFRNGGMNTDDAFEYIPQNDYISGFNTRNTGTHRSEAGNITNPESNVLVLGTRSAGLNKGIGGRTFEDIRQIVMYIYNSAGFHQLSVFDSDSQTQKIIYTDKTDSGGISLLTLDPSFYVNCILINGTYLVWADGHSEVGYTNLQTLSSGGYGMVLAEDLSLIKPQCLIPPTGFYDNDTGKAANFVKSKLFQFIVQYVNADFNYSTWSTWSKRIIPTEESTPTIGADVTKNNTIIVSVNIGSIRARTINIGARYSSFDFNTIKSVDRAYILALPFTSVDLTNDVYEAYDPATNIYSFAFYNDSLTIPIAPTDTDQFVDYIWPSTAIERINGNIIALGDLKVGYDRTITPITIKAVGYNPNLDVPTDTNPDPLKIVYTFPGGVGSGEGDHKRKMEVMYRGTPKTGDVLTIVIYNFTNSTQTLTYTYTVPPAQNNNIAAVVNSFQQTIPNSYVSTGTDSAYMITFVGPPYFELQSATVTYFHVGATVSKSIHALLDNSSYQFALSYRDKWGRPFPLSTDNSYIVKTPSFAQLNGFTPQATWTISNAVAPVGAVDYQWLITKNTTTIDLLDVLGGLLTYKGAWDAHGNTPNLVPNTGTVGDTYQITTPSIDTDNRNLGNGQQAFNTGDYVSYNGKSWDIISKSFGDLTPTGNIIAIKINPLNLFNQRYTNSGINTVLTYDFSDGDRCTLHYYYTSPTAITYLNNPCIDLNVYGYDPATFLVKVEKSATVDTATLSGKDIYLRLYSPNTQQAGSETTIDNTTVWYEIGERFTITSGNHDVLTGNIIDGDVYFKTRQYDGAIDPTNVYPLLATDFNFSDFYASAFTSYGRPRSYYDQLEKTERKASIITSQNYVLGSRNNGLNRFYPESIYGESDGQTSSSYGAIQVLWQRGDMLEVFQELRLGSIPVNISITEDQNGTRQYTISEKLLNNIRYSQTASVGIGLAKESFCFKDNNAYFIDPLRSEPFRYGLDGIQSISGKMSKFFKATLQLAYNQGRKIIMYYNMFYDEVMLCIQAEGGVLTFFPFSEANWQSFDDYDITPNQVSGITEGSHSTFSYDDSTGLLTVTPDSGYVGNDVMQFTFPVNGNPTTKNLCLNWVAGTAEVNPFSFLSLTGQALNTLIVSNSILISGNTLPAPISITGDGTPMYSVNGGSYTASSGSVNAGDIVTIRLTSANSNDVLRSATLTIDGQSGQFDVTTKAVVAIGYAVTEQANPFADANLRIKQNGTTIATIPGTATSSVNVLEGDEVTTEAFCTIDSTGTLPNLHLNNKKNAVTTFNANTPDIIGALITNTFIAEKGATYLTTVDSSATGTSGYTIVNKTGTAIDYDIYDATPVITSSGTLAINGVLNIQTLITGGANSEIKFKAFAAGTFNFVDPPTGATGTTGVVISGAVILDYTVANISTQVGLGLVGRIIRYIP